MTLTTPRERQDSARRVVVETTVPLERLRTFLRAAKAAGHRVEDTDRTDWTPAGEKARIVRLELDPDRAVDDDEDVETAAP